MKKAWYQALDDPGYQQMKYLKRLMLAMPYFERRPDQSVILDNGEKYERLIATRGKDYLMVYNYTGREMHIRLDIIDGKRKSVWWMDAATGTIKHIGTYNSKTLTYKPASDQGSANDGVLIAMDEKCNYLDALVPEKRESDIDREE